MTFIYVSGAGTDSTERGRAGWARVKGKTEIALLRLPFRAAYMFRPAGIEPVHGEISEDTVLPHPLHGDKARVAAAAPPLPPLRSDHRGTRPRHDPRSTDGRSQESAGARDIRDCAR